MEAWMSWLGAGRFVHRVDPVLAEVGGVYLWYYGLSYSLGFLGLYAWLRRARTRARLGLGTAEVDELAGLVALGVLTVGRVVEVLVYEWAYYRVHLGEVWSYWRGGMSSHGLLLGACLGAWVYGRLRRRPFLEIADELTVPGAVLLALGRVGNFVDGQIVGSPTDAWWGVKFPDADGFRHPVVLYDALKNLLLVPILLAARRAAPGVPGRMLGHFVLWYGALRVVVDLFREYPVTVLGLGTGQHLNLATAAIGAGLLVWVRRHGSPAQPARVPGAAEPPVAAPRAWGLALRRLSFAALVAFPLVIPSDWTQDVPERYGKRHPIRAPWLHAPAPPGR